MSKQPMAPKHQEYHNSAEQMRDLLNEVSPSFCLAKWMMVSLHLTNGKTQSCYHPPAHAIPTKGLQENPSLLHNTEVKIKEREQMRSGQRPEGCKYCWAVEDAPADDSKGHLSDRHYRSSEWWIADSLEKIKTPNKELDKKITPAYVEVNFNQACNFKCIYCSPHLSTEWKKEVDQFGPYKIVDVVHNDIKALEKLELMPLSVPNDENPYVQAFWKWWPELYPKLKVFRMTGGEPLVDANTWRVLDYVTKNPNADLELSITSNFCPPKPEIFDRFILNLKKLEEVQIWHDPNKFNNNSGNHWYVSPAIKYFMMFVSCDSVGEQAEYIRAGMNYAQLKQNIKKLLNETNGTSVSLINTFNVLSVPKLKDFLAWVLELREEFSYDKQAEHVVQIPDRDGVKHPPYIRHKRQRIWFDIPLLSHPNWLNVKLLSNTKWIAHIEECIRFMEDNLQKEDYETSFKGFKPYEVLKLKRNLAVVERGFTAEDQKTNEKRFVSFVDELDKRRGQDFCKTFPELADFYLNIKTKA